jgi:hypothetical protein
MHKRIVFFGLSSVVCLAGLVVACSSTTTVTGTDTPTPEAGSKETGTTTKDSGTVTEETGTTTDPDKACGAETTLQACGTCCITNHKSGYTVFQYSLLGCACKGPGADGGAPCATECATTICATTPKSPDATCSTCLQGSIDTGGACQEQVSTDCTGDKDCVAQQACVAQCKGKP